MSISYKRRIENENLQQPFKIEIKYLTKVMRMLKSIPRPYIFIFQEHASKQP